jgi:hypothetical protein
MNFDWYQERTKDESSTIGGWATALAYDFDMPGGYPAGVEVDWVSGGAQTLCNLDASQDMRLRYVCLLGLGTSLCKSHPVDVACTCGAMRSRRLMYSVLLHTKNRYLRCANRELCQ